MHSWETLYTVTGRRHRGRPIRVLLCRGCGMLWNSSTRKPVPICWSRYTPPNWQAWWSDFQRRAAYDAQERHEVASAAAQGHQDEQGRQTAQDPPPRGWRGCGLTGDHRARLGRRAELEG